MEIFFLGVSAAAAVGLFTLLAVWRHQDAKAVETEHDRYMREWQRAQYCWRHPRAARHKRHRMAPRRGEAPLPMEWW